MRVRKQKLFRGGDFLWSEALAVVDELWEDIWTEPLTVVGLFDPPTTDREDALQVALGRLMDAVDADFGVES